MPPQRPCEQSYLNLRYHRWVPVPRLSPAPGAGIEAGKPGNPSNRCWFNDSLTHHQPRRDLQVLVFIPDFLGPHGLFDFRYESFRLFLQTFLPDILICLTFLK